MQRTPKPSAKLLVIGVALAAIVGPLLMSIGSVVGMAAAMSSFSMMMSLGPAAPGADPTGGMMAGGGIVFLLGLVVTIIGAIMALIGLYRLASTVDAAGARILTDGGYGRGMDLGSTPPAAPERPRGPTGAPHTPPAPTHDPEPPTRPQGPLH